MLFVLKSLGVLTKTFIFVQCCELQSCEKLQAYSPYCKGVAD